MTTTTQIENLSTHFQAMRTQATGHLFERNREVKSAVLAVIGGVHHLQLGPPGTAKTLLVRTITSMIEGANQFETLLTGQSLEEELYGPFDIAGLKNGHYLRLTRGYMSEAHFAFVDEVYKGSSTILNSMLWMMNERKFKNDGVVHDTPLITMFGASNEQPQIGELDALDDRFHLRHYVKGVTTNETFEQMMRAAASGWTVEPEINIAQVQEANSLIKGIHIPDEIFTAMRDLWRELATQNVYPTDRRFTDCIKVLRASAIFEGRDECSTVDMSALTDALWREAGDAPIVESVVLDVANPLDKKALAILDRLNELAPQVDATIAQEARVVRIRKTRELVEKIDSSVGELDLLIKEAAAAKVDVPRVMEARDRINAYSRRLIRDGYGYKGPIDKLSPETLNAIIDGTYEG